MLEELAAGNVLEALAHDDAADGAARWLSDAVRLGLLGRPDEAWERVMRCVRWSAISPAVAVAFASALERPHLAAPLLEDTLAREPQDSRGRAAHARAAWMLGDTERARELAVGADGPELDDLLERLGLFEALEARGDDATRARLALWRGDGVGAAALAASDAHRLLGAAATLEGRDEEARACLERALERDPRDQEAVLWCAREALARDALDEAMDWLERASRDGPEGYAVGLLRAHVEARALVDGVAPSGLAGALREPDGLETRYGLPLETMLGDAAYDAGARAKATDARLAALAGNLSATPTELQDGALRWLDIPRSVRWQSDAALRRIEASSDTEALATLDALARAHPSSPHPLCFRGELRLWRGELELARADFEAALAARPTRWAYVGLGAVRLLLGEPAEDVLVQTERFGPAPGATTHVYRGEAHRRAGRTEAALAELTTAVRGRPSRVGAWINLALLDEGDPQAAFAEVRTRAPALLHLGAEAAGEPPLRSPAVLEACLRLMRGNRSSRIVTVMDEQLRVLPPAERLVRFAASATLRSSAAHDADSLKAAGEIASTLAKAPALPAPLPMLGLSLLAVQRAPDGVDLVIGRASPLAVLRVRGPGRCEAIVASGLEGEMRRALMQLASRIGRATSSERWARARALAKRLPIADAL